jgi:hypothetical protein
VKELAGENAPSRQTMEELFGLAMEFGGFELWELITEDQLVIVDAGDAGVVLLLDHGDARPGARAWVYLGDQGLQFFRRAHAGKSRRSAGSMGCNDGHCITCRRTSRRGIASCCGR